MKELLVKFPFRERFPYEQYFLLQGQIVFGIFLIGCSAPKKLAPSLRLPRIAKILIHHFKVKSTCIRNFIFPDQILMEIILVGQSNKL